MQKLKNTEYVWSRLKETFFLNKREGQKENKKAKLSVGLDTEWKKCKWWTDDGQIFFDGCLFTNVGMLKGWVLGKMIKNGGINLAVTVCRKKGRNKNYTRDGSS